MKQRTNKICLVFILLFLVFQQLEAQTIQINGSIYAQSYPDPLATVPNSIVHDQNKEIWVPFVAPSGAQGTVVMLITRAVQIPQIVGVHHKFIDLLAGELDTFRVPIGVTQSDGNQSADLEFYFVPNVYNKNVTVNASHLVGSPLTIWIDTARISNIVVPSPVTSNQLYNVTFDNNIQEQVKIELIDALGTTVEILSNNTPSDSLFEWIVSPLITSGTYTIRITSIGNSTILDESAPFTINQIQDFLTPPVADFVPSLNPIWCGGDTIQFNWTPSLNGGTPSSALWDFGGGVILGTSQTTSTQLGGIITVVFPQDIPYTVNLQVSNISGSDNISLTLQPDIACSAQAIDITPADFDTVDIGKDSVINLTITNNRNTPVTIQSISITGSGSGAFTANPYWQGSSMNLPPFGTGNNTRPLNIKFTPSAAQHYTAVVNVSVYSNGVLTTYTANIEGDGRVPTNPCGNTILHKLPWIEGNSYYITRTISHGAGIEEYAIDIAMPIGDTIVASRGGTVTYSNEQFGNNNCPYNGGCSSNCVNNVNKVVIDHGDGTSSLYLHFTLNGVLVDIGDVVVQGQPIGLAGNSGCSSGPHLHYQLQQTGGSWWTQSIPVHFADVPTNCGQLQPQITYTSGNTYNGTLPPTFNSPIPISPAHNQSNIGTTNPVFNWDLNNLPSNVDSVKFTLREVTPNGTGLGYLIQDSSITNFNTFTYTGTLQSNTYYRYWVKLIFTNGSSLGAGAVFNTYQTTQAATNCITIGNLKFCGNTVLITGNTYQFTGTPSIGSILSGCPQILEFSNDITVFNVGTIGSQYLEATGEMFVIDNYSQIHSIYDGGGTLYSLDINNNELTEKNNSILFNNVNISFCGGLASWFDKITFPSNDCNKIKISGGFYLPTSLSTISPNNNIPIAANDIVISKVQGFSCPSITFSPMEKISFFRKFAFKKFELELRPNCELRANCDIVFIPKLLKIGAGVGFGLNTGKLSYLRAAISPTPIPIFTTGWFFRRFEFQGENLDNKNLLKIKGEIEATPGYTSSLLSITGGISFVPQSTKLTAFGEVRIAQLKPSLSTSISISPKTGIEGDFTVKYKNWIKVNVGLVSAPQFIELRGSASLKTPSSSFINNSGFCRPLLNYFNKLSFEASIKTVFHYERNTGNIWWAFDVPVTKLFGKVYFLLKYSSSSGFIPSAHINSKKLPLRAKNYFNQKSALNYTYKSFELNQSTPNIFLELSHIDTVNYKLYTPNGDSLDLTPSSPYLMLTPQYGGGFLFLNNPQLGIYTIKASQSDSLHAMQINNWPRIIPKSISHIGNSVNLEWDDSYIDGDANISIGYDIDMNDANGLIFISELSEDSLDQYTHTTDSMYTGDYYFFIQIQDTIGQTSVAYFPQKIQISSNFAPPVPSNLSISTTDTTMILTWPRVDTNYNIYNIYCSNKQGTVSFNSPTFSTSDTFYVIKHLVPGRYYEFMVTAMDTLYQESLPSNIDSVTWISNSINNIPLIKNGDTRVTAFVNEPWSYQLDVFNPDGDNLSYFVYPSSQFTIPPSGLINWTFVDSTIGVNRFKIFIYDSIGEMDSTVLEIDVLDTINRTGILELDKSMYVGYDETIIINLLDEDFSFDKTKADSVFVTIKSSSDTIGIQVLLKENGFQSNEYIGVVHLDSILNVNKLHVFPGDTITCSYQDSSFGGTEIDWAYFEELISSFSFDYSGCSSDTVEFKNSSTGDGLKYSWDFGDGFTSSEKHPYHIYQNINSYTTVTVTLVITDNQNRSVASSQAITITPSFYYIAALENATCNKANGSIIISSSGGTGNYSVLWDNGMTVDSLFNLETGVYAFTLSDSSCVYIDSILITTTDSISLNVSHQNATCLNNSGTAIAQVTGGTGNYSYAWNNGNLNANANNLTAGQYIVTVTDANGCFAIDSVIILDSALTVTIDTTEGICTTSDATASATVTGGSGSYNYFWDNGSTASTAIGLTSGLHSVTITDTYGCQEVQSFFTTNPTNEFRAKIASSSTNCSMTASSLHGTSPYTYTWNTGNQTAIIDTVQQGSTYTVTITDANSCTATETKLATTGIPAIVVLNTNGATVKFEGNGTWNFGDGSPTITATEPSHTYGAIGYYLVTYTNNCGSVTDSIFVSSLINVNIIETEELKLKLFPNPLENGKTLTIESVDKNEFYKIEITDVSGKSVYQKDFGSHTKKQQVSVPPLPEGNYIIKVFYLDQKVSAHKLQIKN